MQRKAKKLRLNTKQPFGMWVILITNILFTMGVTTVMICFDDYSNQTAPYLPLSLQHADLNLYINLFLFGFSGIIGGLLGFNIGYKRSVVIGMMYAFAGLIVLSFNNLALIGFSAYIIGLGLAAPNLFTTLSFLYTQDDPRRHAGFTLVYMGSVLGAALAIITIDLFVNVLGYQTLFIIMAVLSLIATLIFITSNTRLHISVIDRINPKYEPSTYTVIFILVILSSLLDYFLAYLFILQITTILVSLICLGFMVLYTYLEKDLAQKKRNIALLVLLFFSCFFWFIDKNVLIIFIDYVKLFGNNYGFTGTQTLSADFMFEANIILVFAIGIISAILWNKNKQKQHVIRLIKMVGLALLLSSIVCLLLFIGFWLQRLHYYNTTSYLLLAMVMLNSAAKVLLLPLYYAMVGKFAPRKYEAIVMGFFFVITAALGSLANMINQQINIISKDFTQQYTALSYLYGGLFILTLILTGIIYLTANIWKKHL